jgi:anti-anti-sigma factor
MNFIREESGGIVIHSVLIKRATTFEADEFREILLSDINSGVKKMVVDLKKCAFLDSTFLGALVIALKTIMKESGDLRLASPHGDVQALLELTGMDRVFQIFNTREEALISFSK